MSGTVTTAEEFARRWAERERLRQQRNSFAGSILGLLDDDPDPPCAPASPARPKEKQR
jgi:hypothetical protein